MMAVLRFSCSFAVVVAVRLFPAFPLATPPSPSPVKTSLLPVFLRGSGSVCASDFKLPGLVRETHTFTKVHLATIAAPEEQATFSVITGVLEFGNDGHFAPLK